MRVFISADMEGVATVSSREQIDASEKAYVPAARQMTNEVAAACEGALDAGATSLTIKDAHWTGRNLDATRLPQPENGELTLIQGWSGHPFSMVEGLDESYDAVAFLGYHSAAGQQGNPLAHTLSGRLIGELKINDQIASEFLIFTYAASLVKVPVVFLSGDRALCDQARSLIPGLVTVASFEGEGNSIRSLHPQKAVEEIREGVRRAVSEGGQVLPLPDSFRVEVEFKDPTQAYRWSYYPGATLAGGRRVRFETNEYFEVLRLLNFMLG